MSKAEDVLINDGMLNAEYAEPQGIKDLIDRPIDVYYKYGLVNGIPVDDSCRNRMIPKDTPLYDVFIPHHDVHVECFNIYPESPDIDKYQKIMQDNAQGESIITVHERTPNDKGYTVLLIYDNIKMVFRRESSYTEYPRMV